MSQVLCDHLGTLTKLDWPGGVLDLLCTRWHRRPSAAALTYLRQARDLHLSTQGIREGLRGGLGTDCEKLGGTGKWGGTGQACAPPPARDSQGRFGSNIRVMPVCSSSKEEIRASCLPRRIWHHSATRAQRLRRAGCMTPQKLVASLPIMFLILCSPSPASAAHRQAHRRPFRNHGVQQEKLLLPEEGEAQGLAGARRGVTAQARAIRGTRRGSAAAGWDSIAAEECPGRPYVNETWLMSEESLEVGIHDCRSFTDVCLDQSAYILYSPEYRPTTQSFPELPKLDISTLLVRA